MKFPILPVSFIAIWPFVSSFAATTSDSSRSMTVYSSSNTHTSRMITSAEVLYWIASEGNLSFANTGPYGSLINPTFDWSVGFKVGLGYNIPHGNWDTLVNFTWFENGAKKSTGTSGVIFPSLLDAPDHVLEVPSNGGTLFFPYEVTTTDASMNMHLTLDVLDWQVGKTFIPAHWFSLRPFAGLKSAWISQHYHAYYSNTTFYIQPTEPVTGTDHVLGENNFWGMGPATGFTTQFWLGKGISLYSNTGIALVYGQFNLKKYNILETEDSMEGINKIRSDFYAGRAIADMQIGLKWDSNMCETKKASTCKCSSKKQKTNYSLGVSWEQHIYFGQAQWMKISDPSSHANITYANQDLSTQGVTFSFRCDY